MTDPYQRMGTRKVCDLNSRPSAYDVDPKHRQALYFGWRMLRHIT
ncbi:hypothetical protein PMI02_01065 [Novosphingobium sp. AP12]|nr:hypothetical protein PMI02_01065 [Novosphingobium sp. AP12]